MVVWGCESRLVLYLPAELEADVLGDRMVEGLDAACCRIESPHIEDCPGMVIALERLDLGTACVLVEDLGRLWGLLVVLEDDVPLWGSSRSLGGVFQESH